MASDLDRCGDKREIESERDLIDRNSENWRTNKK